MSISTSPQNIYDNQEFYEGYKRLRESPTNFNDLLEFPTMRKHLDAKALQGKTILDLGCGNGGLSRYCAQHGALRVCGMDVSTRMIQDAVAATPRDEYSNVSFEVKSLESFIDDHRVEANKFDFVVSSLAFHYIENYISLIEGSSINQDRYMYFV